MLRPRHLMTCAALILATSTPAASQQDVDGFDRVCTAAFGPAGYSQVAQLVPSEANALVRASVRGIVSRTLTWQPGETLSICFHSGTQKARARVAEIASEWLRYANLKFDFGDPADPRWCQGDSREAIKIGFLTSGPNAGYWSAVGRQSLTTNHSMNLALLGEDELPRNNRGMQMPMAEARRLILHEFGHAIGLFHEHQSPAAGCNAEFYEEAVYAYGALRGWSPQRSANNIMQYASRAETNATEIDRKSIMHYSLPPWLFRNGERSPCFVTTNFELSERDKEFVATIYPKVPGAAAMLSARGVGPAEGAAEQLLEAYKKSLKDAGLVENRFEQLIKEFKDALPK